MGLRCKGLCFIEAMAQLVYESSCLYDSLKIQGSQVFHQENART